MELTLYLDSNILIILTFTTFFVLKNEQVCKMIGQYEFSSSVKLFKKCFGSNIYRSIEDNCTTLA